MIQDIYPSRLDNSFIPGSVTDEDVLLVFDGEGRIFARIDNGRMSFTHGRDLVNKDSVFLFSVDDTKYFLSETSILPADNDAKDYTLRDMPEAGPEGFSFYTVRELYAQAAGKEIYAAFTAYHLWKWYSDNRYCGRCAGRLAFHSTERALVCLACGNVIYPRINPAVIVGVIKGDCILITRYREGYAHNALVAGFTEIGETVEETVRREVMEETGLAVKNIRYYKSQPWGMAQDILMGFFCEADGDTEIRMDRNELKYAEWVRRGDIVFQPNSLSLTNEMMRVFNEGFSVRY